MGLGHVRASWQTSAAQRARLWALCACAAFDLSACSFDDASTAAACVPGMRASCPCGMGRMGGQTCRADGTFGSCECILPAGVGGSSASASGSPDGGGSSSGSGGGEAGLSGGDGSQAGGGGTGSGASGTGGGSSGTGGGAGTSAAGAGGASGSGDAGTGGTTATACTPDELGCTMMLAVHWVTRCNAEGTEREPDHACAGYESCREGECHCIADRVYCAENELRRCDAAGEGFEVLQTCTENQTCNAALQMCRGECSPDGCSCQGSAEPCCTDDGACGCSGFLGLTCNAVTNGEAMPCTCG